MQDTPLRLDRDGAERRAGALSSDELAALLRFSDAVLRGQSGVRVLDRDEVGEILGPGGSIGRCAAAILGATARPVRAILFDKTADNNWSVAWHQDRTRIGRLAKCGDVLRQAFAASGPASVDAVVDQNEPPMPPVDTADASQQFFNSDRQIAHTLAGRVIDRIGDRRRDRYRR
jgi:hypothetical protein